MRVLCLINGLASGGAQRQLVGLADLMIKKGVEVEIVYYRSEHFYVSFLQRTNVPYKYVYTVNDKIITFWKVLAEVKDFSPDCIIAYLGGAVEIGCLIKLMGYKGRLIVSERNTTQCIGIREFVRFNLYRIADKVVPNSYSQKNFIEHNFSFLKDKLLTITNFVDTDYFVPIDRQQKNEITHMLVVGRVVKQKNVLLFLETIGKVIKKGVNLRVDWYGDVSLSDYYEKCLMKVKLLGIENIVIFHSESSEIRNAYQNSDVFCLPSIYEGFPNVICEAMACGLPVLCSNVCDNAFIIKEGQNGYLFNPLSSEDMSDCIIHYINLDEAVKKEMGILSRKIAVESFSKENFVEKYMELFK